MGRDDSLLVDQRNAATAAEYSDTLRNDALVCGIRCAWRSIIPVALLLYHYPGAAPVNPKLRYHHHA